MSNKKSPNLSEDQMSLLRDIEQAFADVLYPGDDNITEVHFAKCGAECIECADVREAFRGKKWRDYLEHPYDLMGYFAPRKPVSKIGRDFLPLLQVEALHYYLPLFLAGMIIDSGEADVMVDAIPSKFDPGPKSDSSSKDAELWGYRYGRCKKLLAGMNEAQREATAAALRFIFKDSFGYGVRPSPADAIRNLEAGEVIAWTQA